MPEWMDNTFWAMVALVIFVGLLAYFGIFRTIGAVLDKRIKQIEDDLEEARRLREEAAALLVEYEEKRVSAEKEAEEIVTTAREDAERLTVEAQQSLADLVERRTRNVEDRIAQAESQAVADVRARSADLAIEAARVILQEEVSKRGDALVDQAIQNVGKRLN